MAGEPKEESRSAPNGAPKLFDIVQDELNFGRPLGPDLRAMLQPKPGAEPIVVIGGQRYRGVDNGQANVLIPAGDPFMTPEQRAELERALFMRTNPLAGGAYAIATLAGASPETRNKAMLVGGAADAAMLGAAPRGAPIPPTPRAPARIPTAPGTLRDPIRYGAANGTGQSSYGAATVTKPMLRTGKRVPKGLKPPGLIDSRKQQRGHLIAKVLGGAGATLKEVMTLYNHPNQSPMNAYEQAVKRRVEKGEVVEYFVQPLYSSPGSAPTAVVLSGQGSRGELTPRIIQNVPGKPL